MSISFLNQLKTMDIYREVPKDLTESTFSGGLATIIAFAIAAFLFVSETMLFLEMETVSHTFVDHSNDAHDGSSLMDINLNITLYSMPCALVSVDYQDIMGTHSVDVGGNLHKTRLSPDGKQLGSFDDSAHSITKPIAKQQVGEGCLVHGYLTVKKVPGNFHVSAHAHRDLMDVFFHPKDLNTSHTINHMSFGPRVSVSGAKAAFNPLDGLSRVIPENEQATTLQSFEYYIKMVPTIYQNYNGQRTDSYQFTANTNVVYYNFPAIYFRFDMSPITVQFTEKRKPFTHFLVQLCAIIGGVVTVLGILSSVIHHSLNRVLKKAKMGKLG